MRSLGIKFVAAALLACAAPVMRAQDGLEGALSHAHLAQPLQSSLAGLVEQRVAAADFDNDSRLDGAVLLNSGQARGRARFRVELHLSTSNNTELTFESNESFLSIVARDINGDGTADVIIEQAITHQRLYVWLGDGRGGFRKGRVEDFSLTSLLTGKEARSPTPRSGNPELSLPPQLRFETTLLRACRISGRSPSTDRANHPLELCPKSFRLIAHLASRAPPLSQPL